MDCDAQNICFEDLEAIFCRKRYRIVGISTTTSTRFEAMKTAKLIWETSPETLVVWGGAHATCCAKDVLCNVPEVDVVVRGEGEITLLEILKAVETNAPFAGIKGISYRNNGEVIENVARPFIRDLDSLPMIDRSLIPGNYREVLVYSKGIPALSVLTARGCPMDCVFCAMNRSGHRRRSPQKVISEVEHLLKTYDIEGINFIDPTLTINEKHIAALCKEI